MIEQDVAYAGRLYGNCKHSGFPEYDALTGYVTQSYQREWQDRSGVRWRKTVQIINLGRPDRGIPVDPDKELEHEPFDKAENNKAAMSMVKVKKAERDAVLLERMQEALREHGPMSSHACSVRLRVTKERTADLFKRNPQLFCLIRRQDRMWGLVGVEYDEQTGRGLHKTLVATRDYLIEHGPATAPDIALHLNKKGNYFGQLLGRHPQLFYVVRIRPQCGPARPTPIWGVIGVHDGD
jgi:hypothetical protein